VRISLKNINIPAILIPTMLFALAFFFAYLAGLYPSPIYPDIQPQYIQQMSDLEKRALIDCQIFKAWDDLGPTQVTKYDNSVQKRTDTRWEAIYLMYQDGYWCNRFERQAESLMSSD
jgi:hypothetical protein